MPGGSHGSKAILVDSRSMERAAAALAPISSDTAPEGLGNLRQLRLSSPTSGHAPTSCTTSGCAQPRTAASDPAGPQATAADRSVGPSAAESTEISTPERPALSVPRMRAAPNLQGDCSCRDSSRSLPFHPGSLTLSAGSWSTPQSRSQRPASYALNCGRRWIPTRYRSS